MSEPDQNTLKLYKKAKQKKEREDISDAYFYACPRRYDKNENVASRLFDSTAIKSLNRRCDDLHGQLYPPFRKWINLLPATLIPENEKQRWLEHKETAEQQISLALEMSNFHVEIDSPLTDSLISEGALLLHTGTPECPFVFESVPWNKFYSIDSYDKRPLTNFFERDLTLDEIKYHWKGAENLELLGDKPEAIFNVVDGHIYDNFKECYSYEVWVTSPEVNIYKKEGLESSPWNIYRFDRTMLNGQGHGPVRDVLPDVKTVNKAEELTLKNASIAVTGIWQADDDGVINPSTIKLIPGAIIPKAVGSKGLQPLETGRNFDISQIILSEKRQEIKEQILGASLPDPNSGIRTAYELSERKAEAAKSEVPLTLRLAQTNNTLVKRMYSILTSSEMMSSPYHLDKFSFKREGENLETTVKITAANPLVDLQSEVDFQRSLQAFAGCVEVFGEIPHRLIKKEIYAKDYLLNNSFNIKYFKDEEVIQKEAEEERQAVIQMKAQQAVMAEQKNGN